MHVEFQGESFAGSSYGNVISVAKNQVRHMEKPNIRMFVDRIREQVASVSSENKNIKIIISSQKILYSLH